jgi:hypothetical protein
MSAGKVRELGRLQGSKGYFMFFFMIPRISQQAVMAKSQFGIHLPAVMPFELLVLCLF